MQQYELQQAAVHVTILVSDPGLTSKPHLEAKQTDDGRDPFPTVNTAQHACLLALQSRAVGTGVGEQWQEATKTACLPAMAPDEGQKLSELVAPFKTQCRTWCQSH